MGALTETPHHYREGELKVPQLDGWGYFEDGEPLVWRVRMATASELFRAREAPERVRSITGLLRDELVEDPSCGDGGKAAMALASSGNVEGGELRKLYGLDSQDTPAEVSRRIDLLVWASVHPVIGPENRDKVVELSETHPLIFMNLTNLIDQLSGLGAQLGKSKPSGKTKK